MEYFPLFLKLEQRSCLVIGGGEVATRKIAALLKSGARVHVVAADFCPELLQLQTAVGPQLQLQQHSCVEAGQLPLENYFLVVAASSARLDSEPEMKKITKLVDLPGRRKLPLVFVEVSPAYRSANLKGTEAWIENEEHSQQKGAPSQPLNTPNTYAKLESITAPTLVIAGGADLIAPPGLMRVWAPHIKNSEFSVISDAGHSVSWEQPQAFNAAVLKFLKQH